MDEEKKRKLAIFISSVLLILLIVLIVAIVRRGSGKSAEPVGLSCSKSGQTATITWKSKSSDQGVITYGTESSGQMPFLAEQAEESAPINDGLYQHTVRLDSLGTDTYVVAVSGFAQITAVCRGTDPVQNPQSISVDSEDAIIRVTPSPFPTEEISFIEPTDEHEPTSRPLPTPTITDQLPLVDATSYFNDNPTKGIYDCVINFKNQVNSEGNYYTALGSVCSSAWTQVNLSQ